MIGTSAQEAPDGLDIVVASTFTSTPVVPLLEHLNKKRGFDATVTSAPYGQVVEQLLNPASAFARNTTGLDVCLTRPGDWAPEGSPPDDFRESLRYMASAVADFAGRHRGHLVVCVLPDPPGRRTAGLGTELVDLLTGVEGVAVVRAEDWFLAYGIDDPADSHAAALADVPFTDEAFAAVAIGLTRVVASLRGRPRKVIAVDCDYTLWGGACGDLDPAELTIDDRYRGVQRFLRERHDAGFMLVVCSRNDPASVDRVFAERADDLLLTPEHFVGRRVDWEPKWRNLNSLAAELGVGVDSFVLVDDDPLTCAQTAEALPSIGVVRLPVDADPLVRLKRSPHFDRFFVTREDRLRNQSYRGEVLRAREVGTISSPEELNARLGTDIEVVPVRREHWRRVEQLAARTNQFTCATMTPARVAAALREGAAGWVVSLRDRFGDYGVVGAAVAAESGGHWHVDALMMSCRALNRGVAEALLATVVRAGESAGLLGTRVSVHPTGRNALAVDFLTQRSTDVSVQADGGLLMTIARTDPARAEGPRG
ncbi:HAD-IIIC family phosphatase [Umezawaea tangerina]|uniref:HAD superfamily phosphatase (TIGR01681 family)/FkbH-like protein n=1 Tax=Umezawaea tangerina TaxID=84725 RepID=A0A2T0T1I4_9PSEU|nr:HAD-IIIC family phosphatase [Umezawaea tangerina]PRY39483.1 HAD superfamily phosphatase (TIGR01681 family)/FkbH-like protein [Umezawaea tangerina]